MNSVDKERGHLPELDGLRGIAILLVMLYHMTLLKDPTSLVGTALMQFGFLGWCGVDLFFVLSGFLITGILYASKDRQKYFISFYARRVLRIFPLYYAVVFISLVFLPYMGDILDSKIISQKLLRFGSAQDSYWAYWLYLSNLTIGTAGFRHGILDISWSLAIEEQFYLIWPIAVYFFDRNTLIRILFGVMLTALLFRTISIWGVGANMVFNYVITFARMDSLAAGAILSLIAREQNGTNSLRKIAPQFIFYTGPMLILIVYIDRYFLATIPEFPWSGKIMQTVGFTLISIFFGGLLVWAMNTADNSLLKKVLTSTLLRTFGKYSYALYLFHLPIRGAVRELILDSKSASAPFRFDMVFGSEVAGQGLFYTISIGLSLLAAWLSWTLYETKFLRLKKFFLPGRLIINRSSSRAPPATKIAA